MLSIEIISNYTVRKMLKNSKENNKCQNTLTMWDMLFSCSFQDTNNIQSPTCHLLLKVPTKLPRSLPMEPSISDVVMSIKLSAFVAYNLFMSEHKHLPSKTNKQNFQLPLFWSSSLLSQNHWGGCPRQLTIPFLNILPYFFHFFPFTFYFYFQISK